MSLRLVAPRRSLTRLLGVFALGGLVGGAAGCGGLDQVAIHDTVITDPTQLYMRLTLDHPAVALSTVATYNTLQLTATPRDALGNAMVGLPAPTFHSTDTSRVLVTADGMITAVGATSSPIDVIAELTAGPVRHADTVQVLVTDLSPPPQLASLSIHPVSPDSAFWSIRSDDGLGFFILSILGYIPGGMRGPTLVSRAGDAAGDSMLDLPIEYTSLEPAIAMVDRRTAAVTLIRPGQVRMVARTTAYGITKADTATFTVTMPTAHDITIEPGPTGALVFVPNEIQIRSSGVVLWITRQPDTVDVTFETLPGPVTPPPGPVCDRVDLFVLIGIFGPGSGCGTGNVLVPGAQDINGTGELVRSTQLRQFPEPGVYSYHSTRTGATGRIVVTDP